MGSVPAITPRFPCRPSGLLGGPTTSASGGLAPHGHITSWDLRSTLPAEDSDSRPGGLLGAAWGRPRTTPISRNERSVTSRNVDPTRRSGRPRGRPPGREREQRGVWHLGSNPARFESSRHLVRPRRVRSTRCLSAARCLTPRRGHLVGAELSKRARGRPVRSPARFESSRHPITMCPITRCLTPRQSVTPRRQSRQRRMVRRRLSRARSARCDEPWRVRAYPGS